jgi:hypothetical protein
MCDHDPFPTEGIVLEARQIGRAGAIRGLESRLVRQRAHWVIIDARRVGKTSVCLAALKRIASARSGITLALDLNELAISSELDLVLALRARGQEHGIRTRDGVRKAAAKLRILIEQRGATVAHEIGDVLGAPAESGDIGALSATLAGMIDIGQTPTLDEQLLIFEAWAAAHDVIMVVFLDELQRLAGSGEGTVERLARVMRRPLRRVRLLFAGSETTSMNALFAAGQQLHNHALDFELPQIAAEDWRAALPGRFAEAGSTIHADALELVIHAAPGRPLRTNQICLQAVVTAHELTGEHIVTLDVMRYALQIVERRDRGRDGDDD